VTVDEVIAGVPGWAGARVEIEPIQRGPTNETYRVTVDGTRYCVRIPRAVPSLVPIDRATEYENTLAAAKSGAGPAVVLALGPLPALVLEWIDGAPQTAALLRESPDAMRKLAEAARRLHAGPPFRGELDLFRVRRDYRRICREHGIPVPDGYDGYEALARRIEEALTVQGHRLVPCNNDLVASNLIDEGDRFRIVDYEYSAMNDPCFELGNAAAESQLTGAHVEELVACYFGRPLRSRVARAQLWSLMADYSWTLWACIQHATDEQGAAAWAVEADRRYAAAVAGFEGRELGRRLRDVTRSE
jgi:thiamine kinase-like enzyme